MKSLPSLAQSKKRGKRAEAAGFIQLRFIQDNISSSSLSSFCIRIIHQKRDYPQLKFEKDELSTQELSFRADLSEKHLSHLVKMLMEIGREFPATKTSIITTLTNEGIDV